MSRARFNAALLTVSLSFLVNAAELPPQDNSRQTPPALIQPVPTNRCQASDDADQISNQEATGNLESATGASLRSRADTFKKQGAWSEAQKYYQSALLQDRKAGGQGPDEALDLAGIGYVQARLGNPLRAVDCYQQALAIQERTEPGSLNLARTLNGLGDATQRWGDIARAERYFLQARAILTKSGNAEPDLAISLNGLGSVARQRGDLAKTEALHLRALSIQERIAPHTLELAETLDYLGRVAYLHMDYQKSEDYYSKSLALKKDFADGGLETIWSINGLGNTAYRRGETIRAEELYRSALSIAERFAPSSIVTSKLLSSLSYLANSQGDLAAAEAYQRQALAIQERLEPDGLDAAGSLGNLADILEQRGELAEAVEYGRKALIISQRLVPGTISVANSLAKLGVIADQRGDLIEAEEYYLRALAIRKKQDNVGWAVARSFLALGALAHERRDFAKAEKYYRQALAMDERVAPESMETANSLMYLGQLAENRQNHVRAEYYCRKSLAIKRRIAPGSGELTNNISFLGRIEFNRGALNQAEIHLRQALALQRKLNPDSLEMANSLHILAKVLHARGDLPAAESLERKALAIQERLAPANISHAAILASLGSIMRDRQQWDSAAHFYKSSLDSLENQLTHLGGGNATRSGLRASYAQIQEEYAGLLMQQGQSDLAFEVSDRSRARSLLEMLTEAGIDLRKGADAQLLERERQLEKARAARSSRRIQTLARTPEQQAAVDREIDEISKEYEEIQEQIRQKNPEYASLVNPRTLTVSEVQQLLDENTLFMEYSLGKESSFLWVISADGFAAYTLPKRMEIERQARRLYQLLTAPGQILSGETRLQNKIRMERARKAYWKASAGLSNTILGPASARLQDKRLLIVSDGALQYIPFAALPEPEISGTSSKLVNPPLILRHEIASLPSASVLAALRERAGGRTPPAGEVAVLADPVFSNADARVTKETRQQKGTLVSIASGGGGTKSRIPGPSGSRPGNAPFLNRSGIHLTRLPFSREEARGIMAAIPAERGMMALDFAANLELATNSRLAQYRIVHFATHGVLDSKNPELSGLVFSLVDRQGKPRNGFLDLQSIYNLNLPVNLVVLSACETALGKEIQGEGLVGLTRGFMHAGALRVIASLWKVDDARTTDFMKQLYAGLGRENLTPAAALRRAQIYMWKQNPRDLPFHWAAFELQGY